MRVGIEVGGTFTDLIEIKDGVVRVAKVPSTPDAPDRGALNAIHEAQIDLKSVSDLVHGSTVATNAVLERKGGRVCVFVTEGTRDLFALQRHDRRAIYDLSYQKPTPIVRRDDICEIVERLAADGSIVEELDDKQVVTQIACFLAAKPFDAVAVCLLHSYANSDHERRVAEAVRRVAPNLPVTCSCDVSREFREYERASTTALAAFVQPTIAGYLNRLSNTLVGRGFTGRFSIMQSNGGRMPAEAMSKNAISALFSGPAAGVVGALGLAGRSGFDDIITLDMGGTSTDVSLIAGGVPDLAPQTEIDGLPVRTPVIDIVTVGAGGGSIAWVDDGDLLRVGPQSAGAHPGPASYLRGGTDATVTDAHLVRGTLQAGSFLNGQMKVDENAAASALAPLSDRLALSVEELADSIIRIAESNIVRAIQQVSTERGHDPRDFALVPFGGAGPLHAARVAEELGIDTVVVPTDAGVLSAAGLLMSDYVHYVARTERTRLDESAIPRILKLLNLLRTEAIDYLRAAGVSEELSFQHILEMRYVGQAFEVSVPLGENLGELTLESIAAAFTGAHHRVFEFSKPPGDPVEIVSFRTGARAGANEFPAYKEPPADDAGGEPEGRFIEIMEGGAHLECRLMPRGVIGHSKLAGPILVEDGTSTVYVPPGWQTHRDTANSLILRREAQSI
ncbi:MAG: hydantoinase/oxoprolinase family protein [Rhodobacteraceae bacterium]|nr:hydantoinase/oxoprolinase family protein [Paracoccaceae bacterium]